VNLKIFTVILLAGLFLFNAIGYQLVFAFLIFQQEVEMHSLIAESGSESLELIVIDSSDHPELLIVSEKEFFYKGCLYDVKFKEYKGNKMVFHCKKDEKELNLLNHFSKMSDENTASKKQRPEDNSPFKTLTTGPVCCLTLSQMDFLHSKYEHYERGIYYQVWRDVPTPPPKSFLSA
jgi:hypothetical protein